MTDDIVTDFAGDDAENDVSDVTVASAEEIVVTETPPQLPAPKLVRFSGAILRGGPWPGDYRARIGSDVPIHFPSKKALLDALSDALPD